MALLNRKAVLTTVQKAISTTIIDLNKAIALVDDIVTIGTDIKLYTSLESVSIDWEATDEFYKLADAFYAQNANGRLYCVPVSKETGGEKDLIQTLIDVETVGIDGFSFIGVLFDRTFDTNTQITSGSLSAFVFDKDYHLMIDTSDADVITNATDDVVSVNKDVFDAQTGENSLKIGNVSFTYCLSGKYASAEIMGAMLSQDIGSRTAKFIKLIKSDIVDLTADELQNLLNKRCNVYTGQGERAGQAFVKEGATLKENDFIDTSLGAIWIRVNMDYNLYQLFHQTKVSIDLDGFTACENKVNPVFQQAIAQGIISKNENTAYTIDFTAGNLENREIIGTYNYVEAIAGHFITNTVTVSTGA